MRQLLFTFMFLIGSFVFTQNIENKAILQIGNNNIEYIKTKICTYDLYGDLMYKSYEYKLINDSLKSIKSKSHFKYYRNYDEAGAFINITKEIVDSIFVNRFLGYIERDTLFKILSNPILFKEDYFTYETSFTIEISNSKCYEKITKGEYNWDTILKYEIDQLTSNDLIIINIINLPEDNFKDWNFRSFQSTFYWIIK